MTVLFLSMPSMSYGSASSIADVCSKIWNLSEVLSIHPSILKERGDVSPSFGEEIYKSRFLINLAGFPAQTSPAGISLVTTLPAPTTAYSPIVTGFVIILPAPIKAFFLIFTVPFV